MYWRPSTSHTYGPEPRATKYGAPPTERKARTGELTPPGITRSARSNRDALVVPRDPSAMEPLGQFTGQVGQDQIGTRTFDRRHVLERDRGTVDPSHRVRRFDHGVLPADVIGRDRDINAVPDSGDDIQVRESRLDHDHVGALGHVERNLRQR